MKKIVSIAATIALLATWAGAEEAEVATPRPVKEVVKEEAKKEAKWLTDFDEAKKIAEEKKLPILIDFTGSDWCPWCIRLDQEVFATEEFAEYADTNLVLLKIDFPRKTKLPAKQQLANQKLAEKYRVEGFPTVIIVNDKGDELAVTGYRRGGAKSYIDHLKGLIKKAKK